MLKIERDKKYKLRNGTVVRVLATDCAGGYPMVVQDSNGNLFRYHSNGQTDAYRTNEYDIVAEYREPRTFYINFYGDGSNRAFNTEAEAKSSENTFFAEEIAVLFREVL